MAWCEGNIYTGPRPDPLELVVSRDKGDDGRRRRHGCFCELINNDRRVHNRRDLSADRDTRGRSTLTPPPRSTTSARPRRRSRSWNGPRGACSAARTRPPGELRQACEMREQRSAPAEKRRRRGARRNDFLPKIELSRGKPRPLAAQLRVLRLARRHLRRALASSSG